MKRTRAVSRRPIPAHSGQWRLPALNPLMHKVMRAAATIETSPLLMAKIAADEAMCAVRRARMRALVRTEWRRVCEEVQTAADMFASAGWIDTPARYHAPPPPLQRPRVQREHSFGVDFEHLSFASGYEPHRGEPGRQRWQDYAQNRTAHAWVLRHRTGERPWLVCIPGYSMGAPFVDLGAFEAPWLHAELGLNILIPVLPLHGPRKIGWASGDGFFSAEFLDTIHAETQAIWDLRRLWQWVRAQGAAAIGVYGLSLGGYTAALLGALEEDLACIVAGIPPSDLLGLARHHTPRALQRLAEGFGFDWPTAERIFRVISPLAQTPYLPRERRFIFAGTADRIVPPTQVRELWEHWQQPEIVWYPGSHLSFYWEPTVRSWLRETLHAMLAAERKPLPRAAGLWRRGFAERRAAGRRATEDAFRIHTASAADAHHRA